MSAPVNLLAAVAKLEGPFQPLIVASLNDYDAHLVNKVQLLLDATLGLINIDQNNILKIFSVVTVFLLPPSVIGAV